MRAAVLAVGNELLGSDRMDTNSLRLAAVLARYGVRLDAKAVAGDENSAIRALAGKLLEDHDLLLVTGGLGPTQDDLTREAVAGLLDRQLVLDEEVLESLKRKFAAFGVRMPVVNERQARVIEGASVLENHRGTAPGLMLESGGKTVFLFPGVPHEVDGLVETALVPWLERHTSGSGIETRVFKVACVPESRLEEKLQPFYDEWGEEGVALLPTAGEVTIRLTTTGRPEERAAWLTPRRESLRRLLSTRPFSEDPSASLESVTGEMLVRAGLTIGTAESCTGGLLAERLTRVPGSSRYFIGSVVSYANEVKSALLQVSPEVLEAHGAVSAEVAIAMASGLRRLIGVDLAIAVTGIAGPDGGSEEKPVGTVYVAVASSSARGEVLHRELHLPGDRQRVRWVTSQWALEMVRRHLVEIGKDSA